MGGREPNRGPTPVKTKVRARTFAACGVGASGAKPLTMTGLSLVLLAACASVVGLDDYEVAPDGADAASDAKLGTEAGSNNPDADASKAIVDSAPPITCADGRALIVDHCFFVNTSFVSQPAAKAACVEAGAHLAVVRSMDENEQVSKLGRELDAARWIGFEAPDTGSQNDAASYFWITGIPVTYSNWLDASPPDPNENTSCAAFYQGTDQYPRPEAWVDRNCATALPSICEQP